MRSAFGRYCEELRVAKGLTQTQFAEAAGMSLSRISNIEYQRTNISDDVVRVYLRVLDCTGEEACRLRELATFSNGLRKHLPHAGERAPLQVMLEQYGDKISPSAVSKIQQILEREVGQTVETLRFSSAAQNFSASKSKRPRKRPELNPNKLAEIAMKALELRRTICGDMQRLDVGIALQKLAVNEANLDYKIEENLPAFLEGAFAGIVGHKEGHTIRIEEDRFLGAVRGVHFARHVICHELAHHFLHPHLLDSENEVFFAPQELAKNNASMIGSDRQIQQKVENMVEVEAECFATLFLVPWEAFIKGTSAHHLASDYGEQQREVERYARYFNNPRVLDEFRDRLWKTGQRQHVLFR